MMSKSKDKITEGDVIMENDLLYNRKKHDIKYIEELSLNAWPSHMIELYDGWLIRFSHNYTYRTNSVEQVGASTIPVEEKIAYCEEIYRKFQNSKTDLDCHPLCIIRRT